MLPAYGIAAFSDGLNVEKPTTENHQKADTMTPKTLFPIFALTLLAACGQQQSAEQPAPPHNGQIVEAQAQVQTDSEAAGLSSETHTPAEIRAAENAPPPQKLTAVRSSLTSGSAGAAAASGALGGTGSQLTGNITGLTAKETAQGLELDMSSDVLFDFDKAELKSEAVPVLEKAAEIIRNKGKGAVAVTGHTDSKGDDAYNQKLSLERAETVKKWFVEKGLANEFTVAGKGETDPVAENENSDGSDNPEGRAKNRRVGILVKTQEKIGAAK
ncbi:OmpA family protein [Neisseria weixii]|nr:OmpA family protein [Neisseria weixii]